MPPDNTGVREGLCAGLGRHLQSRGLTPFHCLMPLPPGEGSGLTTAFLERGRSALQDGQLEKGIMRAVHPGEERPATVDLRIALPGHDIVMPSLRCSLTLKNVTTCWRSGVSSGSELPGRTARALIHSGMSLADGRAVRVCAPD